MASSAMSVDYRPCFRRRWVFYEFQAATGPLSPRLLFSDRFIKMDHSREVFSHRLAVLLLRGVSRPCTIPRWGWIAYAFVSAQFH